MTGGGVTVGRFQQVFVLAIQQGKKKPEDWAAFVARILASQGQKIIKEGKPLETEDEQLKELTTQATDFATKRFSQRPRADSLALAFDFTTIGTPEEKTAWVASILDDPSQSEYFESLLDAIIPTSPRSKGLDNDLLQMPTISLDHLKQIQTPTLIVHGQKDKLVPFAQAEAAASLMNHALFLPLPDAGHIIFLGNAARGAQARITEFLQNHISSHSPTPR